MEKRIRQQGKLFVAFLFALVITVIGQSVVSAKTFHEDRLVVWVFDVGQGDAIFIDAPDKQILIDGGDSDVIVEKLTAVMPFWDRSIDVVINTHPHADHVTGLTEVLERYAVEEVWVSGQEYNTDIFAYFEDMSEEYSEVKIVHAGDQVPLGRGALLEVLWPIESLEGEYLDDPNAGSIVTELQYGDTSMLLTGDIGVEEEESLLPWLGHVDVLRVGHQGSKTSSGKAFLESIQPDYSVISVGKNDYGHPHESVLYRFETLGTVLLRTDQDGDVRIVSDGGEPTVTTFDL